MPVSQTVATVLSNVASLPSGVGVVNLADPVTGRITAVRTVREFSIISGNNVQNPFAEVDYKTSGGEDSYNALQMTLARRLTSGLTLNSQYTFARSFGNTAGSNEARTAAIPDNFDADFGYNNFDVRHTFNISALYQLPFGKGTSRDLGSVGNALLGNWEIGGIVNARSLRGAFFRADCNLATRLLHRSRAAPSVCCGKQSSVRWVSERIARFSLRFAITFRAVGEYVTARNVANRAAESGSRRR